MLSLEAAHGAPGRVVATAPATPPPDAARSRRSTPDARSPAPHDAARSLDATPDAPLLAPPDADRCSLDTTATVPLLALGEDILSQCLCRLPDPSAAAVSCSGLAAVTSREDFGLAWACHTAGVGSCWSPMRALAWHGLRGRGASALVRFLIACRRRRREVRAAAAAGAAPLSLWSQSDGEELLEEKEALMLISDGHPCAALMLLAGPYAQHLLLPLVARCGDLALMKELVHSREIPLRPQVLDGDPSTAHFTMATAARAAIRAGRVEAAAWAIERLLSTATEEDVDRTDPACNADPFGLLRFCCRYGTAECIKQLPQLRCAAAAAVARGAPPVLLRDLAAGAAGRTDAAGPAVVAALVESVPGNSRAAVVWLCLPYGCRGGSPAMQTLMVRLSERHGLLSCLPGLLSHSMAAIREVLAAALSASPPISDEHLVHFLRSGLTTALGQPLVEAGQGDTVETAEEIWAAATVRGLRSEVMARLRLPPSVPARVFLERRRLEEAAAAVEAGDAKAGAASSAVGDGRGRARRWLAALVTAAGGGGEGGKVPGPLPDPPATHLLECLEGVHGSAALEAARTMLGASGDVGGPIADGGIPTADSGGASSLTLRRPEAALPSGRDATAAAAVGDAIVAAARGDLAGVEAFLASQGNLAAGGTLAGCSSPIDGKTTPSKRRPGSRGAAANVSTQPPACGFDRMLVAAAKHNRVAVLRRLLPPLLAGGDESQITSRGAVLMGVALQRRQRRLVRLLAAHGLSAQAIEGFRLLQARPPMRQCLAPCTGGGVDDKGDVDGGETEEDEESADPEEDAEADAAVAFELLSAAQPGTRDERLLHSWLMAAGAVADGGARLCGRRAAALMARINAAPELPVGARVAAPRDLVLRAVVPAADLELAEAVFLWLERAELVAK